MSILLVAADSSTRETLQTLLEGRGHVDVCSASSGEEALELLNENRPVDTVLLDADLPGLDGIETCRRIKAVSQARDLPVVLLTAGTEEETLEAAFAAGACDFVAKPIQPPDLLARVRAALHLKRQQDECKARQTELLGVTRDLRRLNEELQRLAVLDELTGISNRRFFNLVLNQEWGRAAREVQPLSLILIDIDYFKNYNDHFGHPRGDVCLKQVATTLSALTRRPGDQVARYGGEEFVVLMPHTGQRGAAAVAELLRRKIEELNLEHPRSPLDHITISLGVATAIPERRSSAELLVAAADQAVYEAKHQGRNRVHVFEGSLERGQPVLQGPHQLV